MSPGPAVPLGRRPRRAGARKRPRLHRAERIALTSNFEKPSLDPRPDTWLGKHSPVKEIRAAGLWNISHVDEAYDPEFLDSLRGYIERARSLD